MAPRTLLLVSIIAGFQIFQSVTTMETSCDLLSANQCNCTIDQSSLVYNISCTYEGNPRVQLLNISEEPQPIKVHYLDLSSNQISELPADFFLGILSISTLNLANNSFKDIPVAIETLSSASVIRLEDNNITVFNISRLGRFSDMQMVDLSHNHISQITGTLENGVSLNIHRLILAFNRIDSLDLSVLVYLSEVHSLDLTHNAMKPINTFPAMTMKHLNLSLNGIENIPDGLFENLQELQELILSQNVLTNIQSNSFEGLRNMKLLDLAKNEISILGSKVLENMPNLYSVDLRENHITTIGSQEFAIKDYRLTQLNLNNNNISTINKEAFGNLDHLTSLYLEGNSRLSNLYRVKLPPHLTFLDLTNCGITELYECDINDLVDLKYLHLQGNNLTCDCHMKWLHQWQESAIDMDLRIQTETHKPWMCKKGDLLIPFHEYPRENFTCSSPLHESQFCPPETSTLEPQYITDSNDSIDTTGLPTSEDINLVLEVVTGDNQLIARWTANPKHPVYGFKVVFMGSEEGVKTSPWLHSEQREYTLTDIQSYVMYNICCTAYHNESIVAAVSCDTMETVSLKVYVGIMAGLVAIVPCFIALAIVLFKDKRASKYEHLQSHEENDSEQSIKPATKFGAANRFVVPAAKTKAPNAPIVVAGPSQMTKKEKPIDVHPKEIESYINQSFAFTDEAPYRPSGKGHKSPVLPDKQSASDQSTSYSDDTLPPPPISADVQCCDQEHEEFSTNL